MTEYAGFVDLPVTADDIEKCSFSNWYPLFKKYIPQTKIIKPLPESFIQYLDQDGIRLPQGERSFYTDDIVRNEENDYSDWGSDSDTDEHENDTAVSNKKMKTETTTEIDPLVDFPELHDKIKEIIKEYGALTPKLNWSAPRDATWILPNNSMKCNEVNEVYLLLNASNYITHDLQHAFDECDNEEERTRKPGLELVLRQWFNINPALEFRIFVKDGEIIGASQRDLNYYDYLESLSDTFKDLIDEFVEEEVLEKFFLKNFVLDLYIPRPFEKVFLIDINPFTRKTDPLMFSWSELLTDISTDIDQDYELRLITENNIGRFAFKEHSENQVPKDIVEASLHPDAIRELSQKWQELLNKQHANEDEEYSENDIENS